MFLDFFMGISECFLKFFVGIRISERFLDFLWDKNFFIPAWVFWGDQKLRILQ